MLFYLPAHNNRDRLWEKSDRKQICVVIYPEITIQSNAMEPDVYANERPRYIQFLQNRKKDFR